MYVDSQGGVTAPDTLLIRGLYSFRAESHPPHFYGEITKTEEGCSILREKGHFPEFARYIRQHATESSDTTVLLKLKSALWAVVSCVYDEIGCSLADVLSLGQHRGDRGRITFLGRRGDCGANCRNCGRLPGSKYPRVSWTRGITRSHI